MIDKVQGGRVQAGRGKGKKRRYREDTEMGQEYVADPKIQLRKMAMCPGS